MMIAPLPEWMGEQVMVANRKKRYAPFLKTTENSWCMSYCNLLK